MGRGRVRDREHVGPHALQQAVYHSIHTARKRHAVPLHHRPPLPPLALTILSACERHRQDPRVQWLQCQVNGSNVCRVLRTRSTRPRPPQRPLALFPEKECRIRVRKKCQGTTFS